MIAIEKNIDAIKTLCNRYNVASLDVFGSVLTDKFNSDSDIDFLVRFKTIPIEDYADNYFALQSALSKLLTREIDLVELKSIRNPVFLDNVERTKVKIYG
ncbi:MAG: nucleotidyltransferase domain-containing protein [Bacteroidales bacterium]|nr:nucleotidyltransferase domain-containing protein [Bacteroidales bacterium]